MYMPRTSREKERKGCMDGRMDRGVSKPRPSEKKTSNLIKHECSTTQKMGHRMQQPWLFRSSQGTLSEQSRGGCQHWLISMMAPPLCLATPAMHSRRLGIAHHAAVVHGSSETIFNHDDITVIHQSSRHQLSIRHPWSWSWSSIIQYFLKMSPSFREITRIQIMACWCNSNRASFLRPYSITNDRSADQESRYVALDQGFKIGCNLWTMHYESHESHESWFVIFEEPSIIHMKLVELNDWSSLQKVLSQYSAVSFQAWNSMVGMKRSLIFKEDISLHFHATFPGSRRTFWRHILTSSISQSSDFRLGCFVINTIIFYSTI